MKQRYLRPGHDPRDDAESSFAPANSAPEVTLRDAQRMFDAVRRIVDRRSGSADAGVINVSYNPRIECDDVELDSDDRWYTEGHLLDRIDDILREHDDTTVGIAEVPLHLSDTDKQRRVRRREPRLRHLARIQGERDPLLYHWSVAELIAYEALYEWWGRVAEWPLGSWPWNTNGVPPVIPRSFGGPVPLKT